MMLNDYSNLTLDAAADLFEVSVNPWSVSLAFGLGGLHPGDTNTMIARLRLPLPAAKALAVLLLRIIRQYESRSNTTIQLPTNVLADLGIPREDWDRFTGLS